MSVPAGGDLRRVIGFWGGTALIVGITIGAGIFRKPHSLAMSLHDPWIIMALWMGFGVISICGALAIAELASMMPRTGGAYVYLVKPFSLEQVGHVLARLLEVQSLRRENRTLREAVEGPPLLESRNPAMRRVLEAARRAAASDATVLVSGESGVGKNVLAAAMHRWSPRADGPFVTIACTSLADQRLDSDLFGHVRGAFAGAWRDKPGGLEAAEGGTAFLDEVGDLPTDLQA